MDRGFFLADARPSFMRAGKRPCDPLKSYMGHPHHTLHGAAAFAGDRTDIRIDESLVGITTLGAGEVSKYLHWLVPAEYPPQYKRR